MGKGIVRLGPDKKKPLVGFVIYETIGIGIINPSALYPENCIMVDHESELPYIYQSDLGTIYIGEGKEFAL